MLAELVAELPDGTVVTDPDIVASYRQDRAADPDAGTAIAVVRPRRTEEVQAVLRWATKHGVPVDPVTRTAVTQPGLFNAEVKKAVAEYGLWYPPDPSSYEICSIGGNIATNAAGLGCGKSGGTPDYVLGVQVV